MDTAIPGSDFAQLLLDKGIRIRDLFKIYQLKNQVRITVGDELQVKKLFKALNELQAEGLLKPRT